MGEAMTLSGAPTVPGAFLQLIEYRTDRPEAIEAIIDRWVVAIGGHRTARWYATAEDRDQPGLFLQIVEFPSYAEAMANSDHPATAQFATELRETCGDGLVFRNLDVVAAARM